MHHLVKSLQSKGKAVTPASIETESLFHAGGTVTREQAAAFLMRQQDKARELARVSQWHKDREERDSRASWNA